MTDSGILAAACGGATDAMRGAAADAGYADDGTSHVSDADATLSVTPANDAAADTARPDASSCATALDCPLAAASCCIHNTCVYGMGNENPVACTDANVQLILASNYDQSCQSATDCVVVAEGNFCLAGATNCPSAAINERSYAKYQADVGRTNAAFCYAVSGCPLLQPPCCQAGTCRMSCGIDPSDAAQE